MLTLCLGVAVPCLADTVNDMATQLTSEEQFAIRQAVNQEMRTAHPTRTTERVRSRDSGKPCHSHTTAERLRVHVTCYSFTHELCTG